MSDEFLQSLTDDGQLDAPTMRLCRIVIERAKTGASMRQLQEHMRYVRRISAGEDKARALRVGKALRTNRWGLAAAVMNAQVVSRTRRQSDQAEQAQMRRTQEAREAFYETVADATALIPPKKRGRGSSSGGRRRRSKPVSRRQPPGTLV